ncbi:MAG: SemiSWEET transporter [Spirochaetota bacterium]|nr:SemiSWEET transporter [Spirochaetota bacterium]
MENIIGLIAGTLTSIAFLPQVIKTWKTKSTNDISLIMFTAFSLGILMWLIYGIIINSLPIIIANSVTIILSLIILYFKIRYK